MSNPMPGTIPQAKTFVGPRSERFLILNPDERDVIHRMAKQRLASAPNPPKNIDNLEAELVVGEAIKLWRLDQLGEGKSAPNPEHYKGHPSFLAWLASLRSRYDEVIADIADVHSKKSADYGKPEDAFANFRLANEVGVEPWRLAAGRMMDKVSRATTFMREGKLSNEGFEDALLDLASYALIVLVLWRESMREAAEKDKSKATPLQEIARIAESARGAALEAFKTSVPKPVITLAEWGKAHDELQTVRDSVAQHWSNQMAKEARLLEARGPEDSSSEARQRWEAHLDALRSESDRLSKNPA